MLFLRDMARRWMPPGACLVVLVACNFSAQVLAEPLAPQNAVAAQEIARALADLQASNANWQRNDHEYRQQRRQNALSDAEARDFAEFVAGLRHRMLADCRRYQDLGGEPLEHAIDCKELAQDANGGGKIAALSALKPALTGDEKTAALDNELRKIETELDELLMSRQSELNAIKQSRPASRASASGTRKAGNREGEAASEGSDASNGSGSAAATGAGNTATSGADGQAGDRTSPAPRATAGKVVAQGGRGSATVSSTQRRGGESAGDISGADDDVLARQLREAAESEPDPILRDKLWDEYRKYKESIR